MREIKFRGYDAENETMYYSDNYFHFNSQFREVDIKNAPFEINELMQFTGLKDKDRVEVYEGDIFENGWVVSFENGMFGIFNYGMHMAINAYMCQYREVVGNIYKNPELLAVPTAVL